MNDTKAEAIKHLAKLIADIADDKAVITSVSMYSEPRFVTYQPLGGRMEYIRTGPVNQTLTMEISR